MKIVHWFLEDVIWRQSDVRGTRRQASLYELLQKTFTFFHITIVKIATKYGDFTPKISTYKCFLKIRCHNTLYKWQQFCLICFYQNIGTDQTSLSNHCQRVTLPHTEAMCLADCHFGVSLKSNYNIVLEPCSTNHTGVTAYMPKAKRWWTAKSVNVSWRFER